MPTSFLAISCNRLGRRLTLWLMALRRMCRGRVWKTSELDDFWATAFNIALISAARAWANVEAVGGNGKVTNSKSRNSSLCLCLCAHDAQCGYVATCTGICAFLSF